MMNVSVQNTRIQNPKRPLLQRRAVCFSVVFLLVLLVGELAARFTVALSQPAMGLPEDLSHKAELVIQRPHPAGRPEILFLGNSLMYMDLYSGLLTARLKDARLDFDVQNLATPSGSPTINLALLKRAVRSGHQPKLVVYNLSEEFIKKPSDFYILDKPFRQSYLFRCRLSEPQGLSERLYCQTAAFSYLYRYRPYFKELLTINLWPMLSNPEKVNRKSDWFKQNYVHFQTSEHGWGPAYRVYSHQDYLKEMLYSKHAQALLANFQPDQFLHDETYLKTPDMDPLVRFCEAQGIPMVLIVLPGYSFPTLHWDNSPNYRLAKALSDRVRADYLRRHPTVHFLDMSQDDDTIHYYDRGHLNAVGAVAFTERLAQVLLKNPYHGILNASVSQPRSQLSPDYPQVSQKIAVR